MERTDLQTDFFASTADAAEPAADEPAEEFFTSEDIVVQELERTGRAAIPPIAIDGKTNGRAGGAALKIDAGTNGVNVNDSATATPGTIVVSLRNISINGAGSGFDGIRFTSGKTLNVEDCVIQGFRGNGANSDGIDVSLNSTVTSNLKVQNTVIRNNTGNGIIAANAGSGAIAVALDNVHSDSNAFSGFVAGNHCSSEVANSYFSFNQNGVAINIGAFALELDTCYMEFNTSGLLALAATARIANCRITGNTNGINFSGGSVQSFGDNKVKGNTNDQLGGSVTSVPAPVKI